MVRLSQNEGKSLRSASLWLGRIVIILPKASFGSPSELEAFQRHLPALANGEAIIPRHAVAPEFKR